MVERLRPLIVIIVFVDKEKLLALSLLKGPLFNFVAGSKTDFLFSFFLFCVCAKFQVFVLPNRKRKRQSGKKRQKIKRGPNDNVLDRDRKLRMRQKSCEKSEDYNCSIKKRWRK